MINRTVDTRKPYVQPTLRRLPPTDAYRAALLPLFAKATAERLAK